MGWGPGSGKVAKKSKNAPTWGGPPREPQTENEKKFFFDFH